jgi:uncharacterized protein
MPLSADHPNGILVRDVYTRWFEGVASPMLALLAEDVVYHLPGRHLGGGDIHGGEELLARGREYDSTYDTPPRSEILDVVTDDHWAITTERHRSRRLGHTIDQAVCGVWRIEGGRAVELWSHFERPGGVRRPLDVAALLAFSLVRRWLPFAIR